MILRNCNVMSEFLCCIHQPLATRLDIGRIDNNKLSCETGTTQLETATYLKRFPFVMTNYKHMTKSAAKIKEQKMTKYKKTDPFFFIS